MEEALLCSFAMEALWSWCGPDNLRAGAYACCYHPKQGELHALQAAQPTAGLM